MSPGALQRARQAAGRVWPWGEPRRAGREALSGRQPHEVGDACHLVHCYGHDVDEPWEAWLVCGECFHRYRSPGELRRLYRREAWKAHRDLRGWDPPPGGPFADLVDADSEIWKPQSTLRVLWEIATVRASKVTFCQVCIHDL